MADELCIKVDVPFELREEFKLALTKIIRELINKTELAIAEDLVSKSKFSEQDAEDLSEKVKLSMHRQLKELSAFFPVNS